MDEYTKKQKGGEHMKDVNRMFALRLPEAMLEENEMHADENTIVLAIVENLRACLKGLPEELTHEQKKMAFNRAIECFKTENCFGNSSSLEDYGIAFTHPPVPCCPMKG